jgi:transcriptional regulator with XRE-family HTH domain
MDKDTLIKNIIHYSTQKKIYPTKACEEAGVGRTFLSDIRKSVPSVEKVQRLAEFLGVTTSELLGEVKTEPVAGNGNGLNISGEDVASEGNKFMEGYLKLNPEDKILIQNLIKSLRGQ